MPNWLKLENDISNWLSTFESTAVRYKNPYQSIPGFPSDGFRSDGVLTDGKILLAVEVEATQMNPDTNVGKYWLLLKEYEHYQKTILFHIYTPRFNSYPWRKRLAEFYSSKMRSEFNIEYILLDYRQSSDYKETLINIKRTILKKIKLEFNL